MAGACSCESCLGKACGRVWRVWSVWGRANGRLERLQKQMAGARSCESCLRKACGRVWSWELPRRVWGLWDLADRLNKDKPLLLDRPWMRPLKLGKPLKHRQAIVAGTTLDNVRAMAVTKQVPHLRWSQAPPLPWRGRRITLWESCWIPLGATCCECDRSGTWNLELSWMSTKFLDHRCPQVRRRCLPRGPRNQAPWSTSSARW